MKMLFDFDTKVVTLYGQVPVRDLFQRIEKIIDSPELQDWMFNPATETKTTKSPANVINSTIKNGNGDSQEIS